MKYLVLTLWAMLSIHSALAQALGISGEEAASIGIYIKDISTGKIVRSENASKALTPASIQKALTSATVMSLRSGASAGFTTEVNLVGTRVDGDVWAGDIEVIASGDPTLDSRHFPDHSPFAMSIVDEILRKGIRKIEGRIIVRQTGLYLGPLPSWELEDIGWDYGAGLWDFNWRDNVFTFTMDDGLTEPWIPDFRFSIKSSQGGQTQYVKGIDSDSLTIYSDKTYKPGHKFTTTMSNPALIFSDNLQLMLRERGVEVGNTFIESIRPDTLRLLAHRSPTVNDILESLMRRSDNMMAEGMMRSISPDGPTLEDALKVQYDYWKSQGIEPQYTDIRDGSGLSRANRLSPLFLSSILERMATRPDYVALFPSCGRQGTVASFLKSTRLEGRVVLKSGSMSGVQCYAGYRLDQRNRPTHTIVVMVNGFFCSRATLRKAIERYLINSLP